MIGFFFANRHSREFRLAMEEARRPLLPELNRNDYEISGRHGTTDFGGETYRTVQIELDICFISDNVSNLQTLAREIAFWLSGKGILFFDDEPGLAYDAVVYQKVATEQLIRARRATVIFECQPFAKTINFLQSVSTDVESGRTLDIMSHGTQATPGIITLRNTGTVNITNITIVRRALNR